MRPLRAVLADLDRPPDTSRLPPCDEAATARAIEAVRRRLLCRRRLLRHAGSTELEHVLGALRRLQNPQLCAYPVGRRIVLSEPFGSMPSAARPASLSQARKFVGAMLGTPPPARLVRALAVFGTAALRATCAAGTRIAIVGDSECFSHYSPAVARSAAGVDGWSSPPSGLFVVEERRVLLRDPATPMAAAHEFAHALDAALAQRRGSYFSFESEELRYYFATATGFVNEYASTGLDEYFAESVRAYVEVNDASCGWLPLTRQDLYLRDPRMFALVERLFRSDFQALERRSALRLRGRRALRSVTPSHPTDDQGGEQQPVDDVSGPAIRARHARHEQQTVGEID